MSARIRFHFPKIFLLWLLPAGTALLLILSYPKFNLGWLAWAALGPLAYFLLRAGSARAAALGGLACGFLAYLGILYWIYPTMRAGGVGPGVSALGLALLALVLSAEFLIISVYGYYLRRVGLKAWPYAFALGWFVLEFTKVALSQKAVWFPWFMLGYTQWAHTALIQVCSLTGVYGLSAAVCFIGALGGAVAAAELKPAAAFRRLLPGAVLLAGLYAFGRYELSKAPAPEAMQSVGVSLLQPSIDLYAKWDEAEAGNIKAVLARLLENVKGSDLVVWPENALPCWIDEPDCEAWLKEASARSGARAGFAGSVSKGGGKYVSAFLLDGAGNITASYNKRQLVPFGEYVPLRDLLGSFITPVAALGEFDPGQPEQKMMETAGLKLGSAICYESIFPYLFAEDARRGADLFVNITNDGWYLDTAAPHQHFIANIFRAVENRRTVARAANNGISGVIDPWGRVLAKTSLNERTVLQARAPVHGGNAFFPQYGHWFAWAALLAVAAALAALLLV